MNTFFEQAKWLIIFELIYVLFIIVVCIRIIWDTRSVSKTLAYLLFVIFVPIVGAIFYFSFGINYRKRKMYTRKLEIDGKLKKELDRNINSHRKNLLEIDNVSVRENLKLIELLSSVKAGNITATPNYELEVLENGEILYPKMLEELEKAQKHIHIEYYIYENDAIGNKIKDILLKKAKEGVEIRFIYDDFGSKGIRKNIARELREAGIEAYPFNKIKLIYLANRLNYRNHRKIVVIDGQTSFIGGINISDKYINQPKNQKYWRDTHLMMKGYGSLALQRIFLSDWNFCAQQNIPVSGKYFPNINLKEKKAIYSQVISSGPDSDLPIILYSILQLINSAKKEILLTTPYYVPEVSLQESLIIATLSGIEVKLLVPFEGDSTIVNITSQSYFEELLEAGVKIYRYKKGFVHAKTFVVDRKVSSVGTANLDMRSFDLNFEVSALIYDERIASEMADTFYKDLENSEEIDVKRWQNRSKFKQISEKFIRLFSPFM